jgi:hypothetical protein
MDFLAVSWGGAAGVLLREWIFLHVMVGGDRGVTVPKELMGLFGAVTDCRAYSSPAPRSVEQCVKQTLRVRCRPLNLGVCRGRLWTAVAGGLAAQPTFFFQLLSSDQFSYRI